ncbi:SPRY domain-containing protein 3 [Acropora cervicornis]|uniref:SPRY domain-containing protein 3 n=1 Tax=Acropora cervicornis TaxID=6130 RepID=A0AAD9VGC1_ACRCE|nr:SPRY domain-containing protein 3 [Acropora cervicornis]
MPGWSKRTVGYHVDDGKIFHAKNPVKGEEVEDAMAYRGDLIGCTIKFEGITNGQVPVVFTLNGRRIRTKNEIWMD